ncbi:MAG: prenyltransferase [Acidobacteria bacterium]|nr:prenyltransferase [Acidobacteriota bacterium]
MPENESDIQALLARRHDNGADYWATPDGRCYVGNPFSTLACLGMLYELGVPADHEAVAGGLEVVLGACREDGRIRLAPRAPLYPCYTAEAARVMCRFGMTRHAAVQRAMSYLMGAAHHTGGWRCNFTRFGRGPETECANPGATLYVLDVVRHVPAYRHGNDVVGRAVESLLDHWESRLPAGPCHWGIGSRFLQVEYPFLRYSLFFYVYVLSFFERARGDARFGSALATLEARLDGEGRVVVERPHRDLKGLGFCARGRPSGPATRRYREIRRNLGGGTGR